MKQFLVAGLGHFGRSMAVTLEELGCDVIAIDKDEKIVQELSDVLTYVVSGDVSDEKNLKALGAESINTAIIGVKDLQSSILCTLLLRDMGVENIIVKAGDFRHGKILEKIGASRVVYPESETAKRIAYAIYDNTGLEYQTLPDDTGLVRVRVPAVLVGKNLIEAKLRQNYNVSVSCVKRDGEVMVNPDPTMPLQKEDILTIYGTNDNLRRLRDVFIKNNN